MIHRQNQPVDPLLSSFQTKMKSQSSTLGGEETGQEKNKEKKSVMMRREK